MVTILRTDSANTDFQDMVFLLDEGLKVTDGDEAPFFAQYNKIDKLKNVVVAFADGKPAGCGAFKEYETGVAEIKRMFVRNEFRGKGIASAVLHELENWALESGYPKAILETGCLLKPAISLYEKSGYQRTPAYGQYIGVESSVCMEKDLKKQ